MKHTIIFCCLLILSASCFSTKHTVKNTPEKQVAIAPPIAEAVAKNIVPNVEPAKQITPIPKSVNPLVQGKILYQNKCNTCHDLKNVKSETAQGWMKTVPEMAEMANRETVKITQAEQDLILGYLLNAVKE